MSRCTYSKDCVNLYRNKTLVAYIECNHCPYWEATDEERNEAYIKELQRLNRKATSI